MNPLNLLYGQPEFMHPYWSALEAHTPLEKLYAHNYIYGSSDALKLAIAALHRQEGNAVVDDKHIVIGNGSTQVLCGLMHILGEDVYADAPYFPRFPIMANISGVFWCNQSTLYLNGCKKIVTTPNNPDNVLFHPEKEDITDASYNWKQYSTPQLLDSDIITYSLSKATGHAATRVGWAILKDEKLAKELEKYIENTTLGVSIEAQTKALLIITSQLGRSDTVFAYGKEVLDKRWEIIRNLQLQVRPISDSGMFLWCQSQKWYNDRGIFGMSGDKFGDSSSKIRLNIGCSEEDFQELISRLK